MLIFCCSFCLCYLYTSYRWAQEGSLPYHKASQVFPPEMKFAFADARSFCKNLYPDIFAVSRITRKLREITGLDLKFSTSYCKLLLSPLIVDLEFSGKFDHALIMQHDIFQSENYSNLKYFIVAAKCIPNLCLEVFQWLSYQLMDILKFHLNFAGPGRELIDGHLAALIVLVVKLVYYLDGENEK